MIRLTTRLVQSWAPYYEPYTTRQTTDCDIYFVAHRTWRDISCLRCASATRLALQSLPQCQVLQTLYIPLCFAECSGLKQGYYCIVASLFVVYCTVQYAHNCNKTANAVLCDYLLTNLLITKLSFNCIYAINVVLNCKIIYTRVLISP